MATLLLPLGCGNKETPAAPYDIAFSPTPTPVVQVIGPVGVAVADKGVGVVGLTVYAIPPSGVPTYTATTVTTGIATFNPSSLQLGIWTFVVPAQTPFPFAPSTTTMAVSVANEVANFNSAGAALYLTPTVPETFTSTNPGSPYTYNLVYSQPGNLFVPAQLAFSSLPNNWSASYAPKTIGYGSGDTATVSLSAVNCVDQAPNFSVTAMDLESTSYPRAISTPQVITKGFTSTVTVSWNTTGLNNSFCNNGDGIGIVYGNLVVSASNSCSPVVSVSMNAGNCCYSRFATPNGTQSAANCGGGSVQFGPGSYSCEIDSGATWGALTCSYNGVTNTVAVPTSGSVQILSTSY